MTLQLLHRVRLGDIIFFLRFFIEMHPVLSVVDVYIVFRGFADTQCDNLLYCNDIKTILTTRETQPPLPKDILLICVGWATIVSWQRMAGVGWGSAGKMSLFIETSCQRKS